MSGEGEGHGVISGFDEVVEGDAVGEGAAEFDLSGGGGDEFGFVSDEGLIPIAIGRAGFAVGFEIPGFDFPSGDVGGL